MDEASRLIADLQAKLLELDHKVLLYRRDMAAQFTKHTDTLLRSVPADVSATVTAAVAASLSAYPSLHPPAARNDESAAASLPAIHLSRAGIDILRDLELEPAHASKPSKAKLAAPPDDDDAAEIPRSPHAREAEFVGVFTQGYLPLLDSSDKHERRSSGDAATRSKPIPASAAPPAVSAADWSRGMSYSPPKLDAARRHSEDTGSVSDPEGAPARRSALRGSPGSAGASRSSSRTRVVRFEFEGQEFATTSSPSTAETSELGTFDDAMAGGDDDDDGVEVEQVEDIAEEAPPPPPRRISSSQALRMLSRGPVEDDGTRWDEVQAPADGSASVSISDVASDGEEEEEFLSLRPRKAPSPLQAANGTAVPAAAAPAPQPRRDDEEVAAAEAAEEADILSEMSPLAPMHSSRTGSGTTTTTAPPALPALPLSPTKPAITSPAKKPKRATFDLPPPDSDSDADSDFFPFEAPSSSPAAPPRPRRPSATAHHDSDSDSSSSPTSPERAVPPRLSAYSSSPARPILRGAAGVVGEQVRGELGGVGDGVVGNSSGLRNSLRNSYHPFATPIVDPVVHEAAARMGVVSSFVGSVRDGWGSVGGGGSLREEGGRSFSERFAMEEWAATGEGRRGG